VEAKLADGSTRQLTITDGAFAYASSSRDDLPTSIRAYDASGRLVSTKDIVLASGVGKGN
jgi:hypothetical protein